MIVHPINAYLQIIYALPWIIKQQNLQLKKEKGVVSFSSSKQPMFKVEMGHNPAQCDQFSYRKYVHQK